MAGDQQRAQQLNKIREVGGGGPALPVREIKKIGLSSIAPLLHFLDSLYSSSSLSLFLSSSSYLYSCSYQLAFDDPGTIAPLWPLRQGLPLA